MTDTNQTAIEPGGLLIIGEFGAGAFGPTILLKLLSERSVDWLRCVFRRLADESHATLDLATASEVRIEGVRSLLLMHTNESGDAELRRAPSARTERDFVWEADSAGWLDAAGLMDPFLAGSTGHQYLTREGIDAALIEISFGEPRVQGGGAD
jgi:hypothetical protein